MNVIYAQLLLFGICIGVASGLMGIGGGIMLVPGLMLLFGFSQQEAQGTSLAALIPPIGIFAAMVYYQNGYVRIPVATVVALGFMIGALFGALLLPRVPIAWLRLAFGGLLLYLGFSFVLSAAPLTSKASAKTPSIRAALPAGLSTAIVTLGAWLMWKRARTIERLPPPDGHTEYHI